MPGNEDSPYPPHQMDPAAVEASKQTEEELGLFAASLRGVESQIAIQEAQKVDLESLMQTTEEVIKDIRSGKTKTDTPEKDIEQLERSLAEYITKRASLTLEYQASTAERSRLEYAIASLRKGLS